MGTPLKNVVSRIFIGGIVEGINFPKVKQGNLPLFVDTERCNDLIIVDRKYFLENKRLILEWALNSVSNMFFF